MAQHDYVIANGTGSAVRSDLNDALAAIVSMNSGSTEPSTTFAFQFWADTNANLLKMRNSANDGWIELRQLDGEFTSVSVANGTAAAPSIFFNASGTDTGIYSNGTDSVDVSTGGTRRLDIGSAGDVTVRGGNVTLNAQGDLRLADSDSSNWVAFQAPATVASNVTWTLPSTDGTNGDALTTNGSGTLSWTSAGGASITQGNTSAEVVDTGSDGHFKVITEGTEALRVDASRRLLVGTSTARANFDNTTNSAALQIEGASSDNASSVAIISNANSQYVPAHLRFAKSRGTSTGSNTVVQSGDLIGAVQFQGSDGTEFVDAANITAEVDASPGANDMPGRLVFSTTANGASSPTERMRIDSSGHVGINTSTASNVTGTLLTISRASAAYAQYNQGTSGGCLVGTEGANVVFYTYTGSIGSESTSLRARLDGSGNLQFNSGYGSVATAYGCRAWVNFDGTGTVAIRASGNVSSITDSGTGDYTVNFTSALVDANYAAVTGSGDQPDYGTTIDSISTSSVGVRGDLEQTASSPRDIPYAMVAVFR